MISTKNKVKNMFKRFHLVSVAFVLLLSAGVGSARAHHIELYKGDMHILKLGAIKRVAVGDGSLLSTSILENGQLLLLAEGEGETKMHIWLKTGKEREFQIRIGKNDLSREAGEIRSLTKSLQGVTQRRVGANIILDGTVDADGKTLIGMVAKLYPNVVDFTKTAQVSAEKMIYLKVQITEFNTSKVKSIGIDWSKSINGPSAGIVSESMSGRGASVINNLPTAGGIGLAATDPTNGRDSFGYFGIGTNITSAINLAKNSGDAYILAEPILSARSGGEAEFLSGGEVPLPTTSSLGSSEVSFKEFGIKLTFKPLADDRGNIIARVETELSTVDQSLAVNNIPGFRTRKASTDVSLKDGDTFVISGLVNSEIAKDRSRLAGLGDIPVLGRLFRNDNFRNAKSELVIFVTPYIVDADSEINKAAIKHADTLREQFFEALEDDKRILD